jgi:predicted small lipoprotein YifL
VPTVFRRTRLVLVLAAALACSACGSSGPLSKPAFIASADSICQSSIHPLQPITQLTSSTSAAVAERILHNAAGTLAGVVNRLGALNAPSSFAAPWRTYVADIRQEVTKISGMANAIPAQDGVSFRRDLRQARRLTARAQAAIAGIGFSHCGQGR